MSYDANGSPVPPLEVTAPELWYTKEELLDLTKDLEARVEELSAENAKLVEANITLRSDNRTLTTELMSSIEEVGQIALERNRLRGRADVQAYEKLGHENISLMAKLAKAKKDVESLASLLRKTTDERNALQREVDGANVWGTDD